MCKRASEYIDREVKNMRFEEMSFSNEFDGIWACASLFHVPQDELPDIIKKIRDALKLGGIVYASFKYGKEQRCEEIVSSVILQRRALYLFLKMLVLKL